MGHFKNIPLENLKKWLKVVPHLRMDFGLFSTSFTKFGTSFIEFGTSLKKFGTSNPWVTETLILLPIVRLFL